MSIPKVFISYSHDTAEHKEWVLKLATRLRSSSGIDIILDRWHLKLGDDLPHFMETNLAESDFVLMICTTRYVEKANKGEGGVGYEKMIVTSALLKTITESKIIPVIRQDRTYNVPTFLTSKLFVDLSSDNDYEIKYDELVRKIHGKPLYEIPPIGNNPFSDSNNNIPKLVNDPMNEFLRVVAQSYEDGDYLSYETIRKELDMSRINYDILFDRTEKEGYVFFSYNPDGVGLTTKGKVYVIDNKLLNNEK